MCVQPTQASPHLVTVVGAGADAADAVLMLLVLLVLLVLMLILLRCRNMSVAALDQAKANRPGLKPPPLVGQSLNSFGHPVVGSSAFGGYAPGGRLSSAGAGGSALAGVVLYHNI